MGRILWIAVVILLSACEKNGQEGVEISVENSIDSTIDSVVLVYDPASFNYGTINTGQITNYHFYQSATNGAAATFLLNGEVKLAGRLFFDPPFPQLEPGQYVLRIFADTTLPSGYNAEFLKQ